MFSPGSLGAVERWAGIPGLNISVFSVNWLCSSSVQPGKLG